MRYTRPRHRHVTSPPAIPPWPSLHAVAGANETNKLFRRNASETATLATSDFVGIHRRASSNKLKISSLSHENSITITVAFLVGELHKPATRSPCYPNPLHRHKHLSENTENSNRAAVEDGLNCTTRNQNPTAHL
ncbi:hypothetical protein Rs2_22025 [Raphanus sativus]|nr:hypothetical protein Rs2_22025 [Raphanus sativus]